MQISGANLLIASQLEAAKPPQPKAGASFAAALGEPKSAAGGNFEPLAFKQVAPEPTAQHAETSPHAAPNAPIGSQLDIRV